MGIKARYTAAEVHADMLDRIKRFEKAIIMRLERLGEMCVNEARTSGSFTDRTGNLRSSEGYVVVAHGEIVSRNFKVSGKGTIESSYSSIKTRKTYSRSIKGGSDGVRKGEDLAEKLALEFTQGFALIVVAGMNYAYYVETKGFNVLSSSEHFAQSKLPAMLSELKKKF